MLIKSKKPRVSRSESRGFYVEEGRGPALVEGLAPVVVIAGEVRRRSWSTVDAGRHTSDQVLVVGDVARRADRTLGVLDRDFEVIGRGGAQVADAEVPAVDAGARRRATIVRRSRDHVEVVVLRGLRQALTVHGRREPLVRRDVRQVRRHGHRRFGRLVGDDHRAVLHREVVGALEARRPIALGNVLDRVR